MNHLSQYLIQSSACLAALYLVYWLFLRRETFFSVNRFFLVTAALLSMVIPLVRFSLYDLGPVRSVVIYLDPVIITPEKIGQVTSGYGNLVQTAWIIYITGVVIFMARFLFQIGQLIYIAKRHEVSRGDGINLVLVDQSCSPFSFFHYVFVNRRQDQDDEISTIIRHERIHVLQWHSADMIIMELLIIVQWFNPFAWFIGRSIKTVHEFLADEGVLKNGFNATDYQELLLTRASGIQVNNLTNNFNVSLLKKRIIMMTKTRSTVWARWKIMLALPAFMAVLFLFSTSSFSRIMAQQVSQNSGNEQVKVTLAKADVQSTGQQTGQTEKKSEKKQQVIYTAPVKPDNKSGEDGGPVFSTVEKQPSFSGGQEGLVKFLSENIKYPALAMKNKVEGTVFVTFVVKADGSVASVKVLRGIGSGCDEESVRVVSMMPKWNPGTTKGEAVNVQFNLPIKFKLDAKKEKEEKTK